MRPRTIIAVAVGAVALAGLGLAGCAASMLFRTQARTVDDPSPSPTVAQDQDVLRFTLTANDGTPYPLEQLRGKVVMLVNTASECGFTDQYAGLQQLYAKHQADGLVIVAIPTNDFLGQEPGSDSDIKTFCTRNFGVTFPLMAKATTKGDQAHPLFVWLQQSSPLPGSISWNFSKFLVGRDGRLIARFEPRVAPGDERLVSAVTAALAKPAPTAPTAPPAP